MELFKIDTSTGDILISWYLWQKSSIQQVWESFTKNKLEAARLIQYAVDMSDLSPYNTYRNMPIPQRSEALQLNLWGIRNPRVDKPDIQKIISQLEVTFKQDTAYIRVAMLKRAVAKLHSFINEFSADKENTEAWKDFAMITKNLTSNEKDLAEAEKVLKQVLETKIESNGGEGRQQYYD